jgi:hypothetical protein
MRTFAGAAYRWLIAAYVICVIVQFFLAAAGVFGEKAGVKLEDQSSWDPHRAFGFIALGGGSLLLLLVCLAWWPDRIWLLATFLLALLAFVVQPILAGQGEDHRWVGALHGGDAGLILLLSGWLAYRAWRRDLRGG